MREALKTEILTIDVIKDDCYEVREKNEHVRMVTFHGESESYYFKGKILPGGVYTQKQLGSGPRTFSSSFILEGIDFNEHKGRIYIENNGTFSDDGSILAKPTVFTDSWPIGFFNTSDLVETVTPTANGVKIRIYTSGITYHEDGTIEKLIYRGKGVVVIEIDGKLMLTWNTGICDVPVYHEITEELFEKFKRSPEDEHEVCMFCINRDRHPSRD